MNKTGTIYIIKCKDTKIKDCYIGSTINLKRRKIQQKSCYKNPNSNRGHLKLYQFMRENGGFINFEYKILEDDIEFNNRNELNKIERYYIEEFESSLNNDIPSRTDKQYKEDNKDKIKKQNKEYQKKNQKNIKKQRKIYREKNKGNINCNCGSTISKLNYLTHCKTKKHLQYIENNN
tara:strand:- start:12 stop:542 length:531 start_codon:yes stop_codon:yes gene_type:complete